MKKFFFLAGLPRSGSTLLAALLSQNKAMYVSGTSGILELITANRNYWSKVTEFNALDPKVSSARKISTLRGMLYGHYDDIEQTTVIDKCRQWPAHFEMAQAIIGEPAKMIITVRDIRDVLASFERKYREAKADTQVSQEALNSVEYQSVEGRCDILISTKQIVGGSIVAIRDAVNRGFREQMHFVDYDDLCKKPTRVLEGIYDFLGIHPGDHDTLNVKNNVVERDEMYGWKDLHAIRGVIQPQEPQWPKYLPDAVAKKFEPNAKFWKSL